MFLRGRLGLVALVLLVLCSFSAFAAEVPRSVARQVAERYLHHHVAVYGDWAGSKAPRVERCEPIEYRGELLAFNFVVSPSGHLLVPHWDEFSPVLLYSTTSDFVPDRIRMPGTVESWVIPEMYAVLRRITERRAILARTIRYSQTRVAKAWQRLKSKSISGTSSACNLGVSYVTVGPFLTTRWSQGSPYNQYCPGIAGSCDHCVVGCVATALAQVMKYWEWPDRGTGSHTYYWSNGGTFLSADFNHEYYWSNMPDVLYDTSTAAQKDAVARLCSDAGIALNMNYGCGGSGSSLYADNVLDVYFKYKSTMQRYSRSGYTDTEWMNLFKAEFDALPPRPVVLSIWSTDGSAGHETVTDGYQTGLTDKIHINFGWGGWYDGYYDITHNFTALIEWSADTQIIVTRIEPDIPQEPPPEADFTAAPVRGKSPLTVEFTNTSTGTITSYLWTFGDGASSALADPSHVYTGKGTYTVTLTVTGPGGSDTETKTDLIRVYDLIPIWIYQILLGDD